PWEWRIKKMIKNDQDGILLGDLTHWYSKEKPRSGLRILDIELNKYNQPEICTWNEYDAQILAKAPEYLKYMLDEVDRLEAKLFLANQKIADLERSRQ